MSDLPLRYRINEAVFNAQSGNINDATESVLAIIREAMLAPSTIAASHKGVPPPCQIERVLTNALDEVFGTE